MCTILATLVFAGIAYLGTRLVKVADYFYYRRPRRHVHYLLANVFGILMWLLVLVGVAGAILMPGIKLLTWNDNIQMASYWDNCIQPNIAETHDNYVVVTGLVPGVWQSGSFNLPKYNSSLSFRKVWLDIPVVGWAVDKPREDLKFVKVVQ